MSAADESDLWGAIAAHPADDNARLVYADWLSERGDPRGELIALQVQQARLHPGTPAWARIQRRADVLLFQHWERWKPNIQLSAARRKREPNKDPEDFPRDWRFLRGFAERLRTVPQLIIDYGSEVKSAAPLLWDLRLDCQRMRQLTGWVDQLTPKLHGIRQLGLAYVSESALIVLAGRAELRGLTGLVLEKSALGVPSLDALAHPRSSLLGITRLELSNVSLNDTNAARLFKGAFGQLNELSIQHEKLGPRAAAAMAGLVGLKKLELNWCALGDEPMERLLSGPITRQLEVLDLSYMTAGSAVGRWLREPPKTLEVLRLAQSRLANDTTRALLESDALQQLELLDLSKVELDESDAAGLLSRYGERVLFRTEDDQPVDQST